LGVRLAYGDVTDRNSLYDALADQAAAYHVAGRTRTLSVADLYRVNEQGVRNMAEACASLTQPPVLVIVSSLAAVGPAPEGRPRTETDPPAPVSHYGRSKRAGELAARKAAARLPITIVRPPIIFGPNDRASLEWFKGIKRFGVHLVPGWKQRTYSMIYAADLANLLILAAERGRRIVPTEADPAMAAQGCYFADCGEYPTYAEMGRKIARALGRRRVLVWHMTMPVVWTATAIVEMIGRIRRRAHYVSFDKIREASAGNWICSGRKAAEELGFAVTASLDERLRQTARWYCQQGWL
jgi:nucleoside-diphosphate-sugar epimerase